uniref:TIL domain-containing protein n=1 Tax=Romanomermis culicivorax TaxID=13658 RepID=A0A915JLH0_ROMCU
IVCNDCNQGPHLLKINLELKDNLEHGSNHLSFSSCANMSMISSNGETENNQCLENEEFKCQLHRDPTCSDVVAGRKMIGNAALLCWYEACYCKNGYARNAQNKCVLNSNCLTENKEKMYWFLDKEFAKMCPIEMRGEAYELKTGKLPIFQDLGLGTWKLEDLE